MAFILPPYMQDTLNQPGVMSYQQKSTQRTAPQSVSSLLGIFNQMPQFQAQGIGEQKIRDLFSGSVGAARRFGMEQARSRSGERGGAPVQRSEGVEAQNAARLGLFTQAPMIEAIMKDLGNVSGAQNSYLAQILGQLMQAASGPVSEGSSEATGWRSQTAGEINPGVPRVQYPSQGSGGTTGGGGSLGGSKLGATMDGGGGSSTPWWQTSYSAMNADNPNAAGAGGADWNKPLTSAPIASSSTPWGGGLAAPSLWSQAANAEAGPPEYSDAPNFANTDYGNILRRAWGRGQRTTGAG